MNHLTKKVCGQISPEVIEAAKRLDEFLKTAEFIREDLDIEELGSFVSAILSAAPTVPHLEGEDEAGIQHHPELHAETKKLVDGFAKAMSDKLYAAQEKYGYSDRWANKDWMDECRAHLVEHLAKGDPRDVANYCAFLWWHGEKTVSPETTRPQPIGEIEARALEEAADSFDRHHNCDVRNWLRHLAAKKRAAAGEGE